MINESVGDILQISKITTLGIKKFYCNIMSDKKLIKKVLNKSPLINNSHSKYKTNYKRARQMVQNIKMLIKNNFNKNKNEKYPIDSRSIKTKKLKNWWEKIKIKCKIKKKN